MRDSIPYFWVFLADQFEGRRALFCTGKPQNVGYIVGWFFSYKHGGFGPGLAMPRIATTGFCGQSSTQGGIA